MSTLSGVSLFMLAIISLLWLVGLFKNIIILDCSTILMISFVELASILKKYNIHEVFLWLISFFIVLIFFAIFNWNPKTNVVISIGLSVAWAYGLYAWMINSKFTDHIWRVAIAIIVGLIFLGRHRSQFDMYTANRNWEAEKQAKRIDKILKRISKGKTISESDRLFYERYKQNMNTYEE